MAVIEGTDRLKMAVGEYDFAVGTITLRGGGSLGAGFPSGAVIVHGYIEVDTIVTSGGAATVAAGSEATGDIQAAALVSGAPWSTTGRKAISFSGAKTTTGTRALTATIAVAALTAGKFRVVVFYR
jgi:hypothetical protein